eukprot:873601-Ditylum_brightwellii.AAC.1
MEQSEFIVVTDGLVREFDTSFGWKVCTLNGENIAEHACPAFRQASSFRAEGYGVLSALRFFRHAIKYMASTKPSKGQLYLDNKG